MCAYACVYVFVSMLGNECVRSCVRACVRACARAMPPVCECMRMLSDDSCVLSVRVGRACVCACVCVRDCTHVQ